jgi:hypothetical protein
VPLGAGATGAIIAALLFAALIALVPISKVRLCTTLQPVHSSPHFASPLAMGRWHQCIIATCAQFASSRCMLFCYQVCKHCKAATPAQRRPRATPRQATAAAVGTVRMPQTCLETPGATCDVPPIG